MADFDFFHQFRDKMCSLRPSPRTAGEDWQALSQRLDMAMPAKPAGRRWRMAAAALLLLLLASNAWWGFTFQQQNGRLEQLTAEVTTLKTVAPTAACEEVKTLREQVAALQNRLDETKQAALRRSVFQPIFGEKQAGIFSKKASATGMAAPDFLETALAGQAAFSETGADETGNAAPGFLEKIAAASGAGVPIAIGMKSGGNFKLPPDLTVDGEASAAALVPAEMLPPVDFALLEWTIRPPSLSADFTLPPAPKDKPPVTKKIAAALLPKTFRAGLSAGWLLPLGDDLQHQSGYTAGLRADLGFSRRWTLSAGWDVATLHYKALSPDAAIGLASVSVPSGQQFLEMDVTMQRMLLYSLGLRHTLLPKTSWRPFIGGGWSGLVVLPFETHVETQVEASGNIQKSTFEVGTRSGLKHYVRLSAGAEIPLGRRFDFLLEGSYLRQWKGREPSMVGIRSGLSFLF